MLTSMGITHLAHSKRDTVIMVTDKYTVAQYIHRIDRVVPHEYSCICGLTSSIPHALIRTLVKMSGWNCADVRAMRNTKIDTEAPDSFAMFRYHSHMWHDYPDRPSKLCTGDSLAELERNMADIVDAFMPHPPPGEKPKGIPVVPVKWDPAYDFGVSRKLHPIRSKHKGFVQDAEGNRYQVRRAMCEMTDWKDGEYMFIPEDSGRRRVCLWSESKHYCVMTTIRATWKREPIRDVGTFWDRFPWEFNYLSRP